MYSEKYKENFTKDVLSKNTYNVTVDNIIDKENEYNTIVYKWNGGQISKYLKSFQSKSPVSINKHMCILRKFANFVANNENYDVGHMSINNERFFSCIDMGKLLKKTINIEQYNIIMNQLLHDDNINVRDRLLFQFAWEGFTPNQIKNLKTSDVIFDFEDGTEIVKFKSNKVIIKDRQVISDLKETMMKDYHIVNAINASIIKKIAYAYSEYLFKPVRIGKNVKTQIANPTISMQTMLRVYSIKCDGVDVGSLSIEDMRRSKIIYLISKGVPCETIMKSFKITSSTNFAWLNTVSKIKYP